MERSAAARRQPGGGRAAVSVGAGQVVYLVLEEQREVHVILVQWWG